MFFAFPSLLMVPVVVAVVGLWGLYRGRFARVAVSSVWLWRGLVSQAGGKKSRWVDPLWALVWVAAVLAGLALTGWHVRGAGVKEGPRAEVGVSMRALAGAETGELLVRLSEEHFLSDPLTVEVAPATSAATQPAVPATTFSVPLTELRAGRIFTVPAVPTLTVAVRSGEQLVSRHVLTLAQQPAFNLLTLGPVSPALQRALAIQPGARVGIPEGQLRSVFLVDDPAFDLTRFSLPAEALLMASARTPLPGITAAPAPWVTLQPAGTPQLAASAALLADVSLSQVQVHRYRRVELAVEWTVLATVEQKYPWLATRSYGTEGGGGRARLIYLSSPLTPDATNWPVDPSFIIFVTNAVYPPGVEGATHTVSAGVREWVGRSVLDKPQPELARWHNVTPYLAGVALGLIVIVVGLLVRRQI